MIKRGSLGPAAALWLTAAAVGLAVSPAASNSTGIVSTTVGTAVSTVNPIEGIDNAPADTDGRVERAEIMYPRPHSQTSEPDCRSV